MTSNKTTSNIQLRKNVKNNYISRFYRNLLKYLKLNYYKTNIVYVVFTIIYLLIQIILVIFQMHKYREYYYKRNYAILVARACGILIAFNISFTILLILKRLITELQSIMFVRRHLPFYDFTFLHKTIGKFVLILSIIHTVGQCFHICKNFSLF